MGRSSTTKINASGICHRLPTQISRFAVILYLFTLTLMSNASMAGTLSLVGPADVTEGEWKSFRIHASETPEEGTVVTIGVTPVGRITVPTQATFFGGWNETWFDLIAPEDTWIDEPCVVTISISATNWIGATNQFVLHDNESRNLLLTLPGATTENAGILTNVGQIQLAGKVRTNTAVQLTVSPVGQILVPTNVTIAANQSSAKFNVTVLQDVLREGRISINVDAAATNFISSSANLLLDDDDPSSLVIDPVSSPQFVGVPLTNRLRAFDVDGQILRGSFEASVWMATSTNTNLVFTTTVLNGQSTLVITPAVPGFSHRLVISDQNSMRVESNPFNVIQPDIRTIPGAVRDIAVIPGASGILASIPSGSATHSGEIVSIDRTTGSMTTWAVITNGISPTGASSGRLCVSPDGSRLFVAATNGNQIQAWNTTTRTIAGTYVLPNNQVVADMASAEASPWRLVVAAARTNGSSEQAIVLNQSLSPGVVSGAKWVRSVIPSPTDPETFFIFRPYQIAKWTTGAAGLISETMVREGPYFDAFLPTTILGGRIFTGNGWVTDIDTRLNAGPFAVPQNVGAAPRLALIAPDAFRGEIVLAVPGATGTARLQSFNSQDLEIRRDVGVALSLTSPKRLVLCDSNTLALVANDTLSFIGWPSTLAGAAPVDLGLSAEMLPVAPKTGTNWNWTVTVTNRGATAASDVKLRLLRTTETDIVSATMEGADITTTNNRLLATLLQIPAGQSVSLQLTLRPRVGGWTTNIFTLSANEEDITLFDNHIEAVTFVQPANVLDAPDTLRLGVRAMEFDESRRKIYALERVSSSATATRLYSLDSDTLVPQLLRNLPGTASHLRLSRDCRFLYAAVEGGRAMQRIDLAGAEADNLFETFNPNPALKYCFLDFAVDPLEPRRILAAACIETNASFDNTTAAFLDGVKQTNVVSFRVHSSSITTEAHLKIDAVTGIATLGTGSYPERIVQRMQIVADGLDLVGQYSYDTLGAGFLAVGDRLYSARGQELAAATGQHLRSLPQASAQFGLLAHASQSDRIVFVPRSTSSSLQVYDRRTLGSLGSAAFTLGGIPDAMVLLDGNRMAIATSDSRVTVISSSLLETLPLSELSTQLNIEPTQPVIGSPVTIRILVTNAGPASVIGGAVTCELPYNFIRSFTSPTATGGYGTGIFPFPVFWTLPSLPGGGSMTYEVRGTFTSAGQTTVAAGIAARNAETNWSDNHVTRVCPVRYSLSRGQSAPLNIRVTDAVYDSSSDRIIAIVSGNHELAGRLAAIDPFTGLIVAHANIGANPSRLTLAGDQQTVYVAIENKARIARVNLSTLEVVHQFPVNPHIAFTANPGDPAELVVYDGSLSLYDDGVRRGPALGGDGHGLSFYGPNSLIGFDDSFPFLLHRYRVTPSGVLFDGSGGPSRITGFKNVGGLLFATDGRLVEAETFSLLGKFNATGPATADIANGLVFFAMGATATGLQIFDLHTQSLLALEKTADTFWQTPVDLFHAGTDLLACRFDNGNLAIIRSAYIPVSDESDLAVGLNTSPWSIGELCTSVISVTNHGPARATNVRVDVRMPEGMRFASATSTVISAVEPNVSFSIGDLNAGQVFTLEFQSVPQTASLSADLVTSIRSTSMDPVQSNNVCTVQQVIETSHLANRVDALPIVAEWMVYDSVARLIYLTSRDLKPGVTNVLMAVDPYRGTVQRQITLPGVPGRLAISSGGKYLYVSLNGGSRISRLTLPQLELDLNFATGSLDPSCDLEVLPGSEESIVLSGFGGGSPSPAGVWLFDGAQSRSNSVSGGYQGVTYIAPGLTASELVCLDYTTHRLRAMSVNPDGLMLGNLGGQCSGNFPDLFVGGSYLLAGQKLFYRTSLLERAQLAVPFSAQAMTLSTTGNRAVFIANSNRAQKPIDFATFNTETGAMLGHIQIAGPSAQLNQIILFDQDGIAALANGWLLLGRLDLAAVDVVDSDGDNIPDWWEEQFGLNPFIPDGDGDLDQDGASNFDEYVFATVPNSAQSAPTVFATRTSTGQFRLAFRSAAGRLVKIEANNTLLPGSWTPVGESPGTGGWQVFTLESGTYERRFVRLRIDP